MAFEIYTLNIDKCGTICGIYDLQEQVLPHKIGPELNKPDISENTFCCTDPEYAVILRHEESASYETHSSCLRKQKFKKDCSGWRDSRT